MQNLNRLFFLLLNKSWIVLAILFISALPSEKKLELLYHSIPTNSIEKHLAYYQLYPQTTLGKETLRRAWSLLGGKKGEEQRLLHLPHGSLATLLDLLTGNSSSNRLNLSENEIDLIESLAKRLPRHSFDLGRALLIQQLEQGAINPNQVKAYEALLDLMALKLLTQVDLYAEPQEKITAINTLLFEESGFHFPPEESWKKDIYPYTALPHVIDSREGVCLGISLLYLTLAERIALPLHTITPPGHIFVQWGNGETVINIETTARGIHLPSERYLDLNSPTLEIRDKMELLGLVLINQASTHLKEKEFEQSGKLYQQALTYLPNDPTLTLLLGLNSYLLGNETGAYSYLKQANTLSKNLTFDPFVTDILNGKLSQEAAVTLIVPTENNQKAREEKIAKLEELQKKLPESEAIPYYLAHANLEINRFEEALVAFESFHRLNPNHPTVEFLLAMLSSESRNFPSAWKHYNRAETLLASHPHAKKTLREFRLSLWEKCPPLQ